ncbi:MAG: fibronectin type III domain-containing protein, partial [Vicinamibacterales bacterium]
EQREMATLIATLPVRPILPDLPILANGSAPPPLPLPPGVDRGMAVAILELLTADARVPVELPVEKLTGIEPASDARQEHIGPLVAPAPTQLPRRHYFVVSKSPRGRESLPSSVTSVPLEAGSSAPGQPVVTHTASDMTITWAPSPDARTATFLLPPRVKPVAGADVTPGNVTPKLPPPLPPLVVKSLGFNTEATTYHVYDVTPVSTEPDPYAIAVPTPLTPAPVVEPEYVIKSVAFNAERCFEVRPIDTVFGSVVIGPPSPRTCVTPLDTFPPVAPKNLAAIAGSGVINLIWDANAESDLAGYIVLRGEAPGDTLQAVTPEPVTVTSYRDESVRAGTRYVYVVVAVDRAVPQNVSPQSNRAEETARQ